MNRIHHEPPPSLSRRERQVLSAFASGMKGKDIAKQLSINVKTVSTYKSRLLSKLGLRTPGDLIRYATEEGRAQTINSTRMTNVNGTRTPVSSRN